MAKPLLEIMMLAALVDGKPDEYENMIVVPTLVSKKGLMYKFEAGKKQGILDYLERYVNSI